jgi:succinate dehydrogenase / fumarate reductase cytochrome b subunit
MVASIMTRFTGVGLYVGILIVVAWAVTLASGPDSYDGFMGLMSSFLGRLVLFGVTFSLFYHLAAGIRHLVFDTGHGFTPKTANMSAALSFAFAIAATLVIWALAFAAGAL